MQQIYIHGLGQTPDSWEQTIAYLKDGGNAVCPDLAGILQGQEVSYGNLYRAFAEVCDKSPESLHLCGLSLGGVLALHYAIDRPERVHSLVLIAAQYQMPKNVLRFQNAVFRFMPKAMFQQTGFGKKEFIHLCRTMMDLDFGKALSGVSCPALVLCGEKDSVNKKAAIKLADALPNAAFREIKGAGHEVNRETPEQLAKLLTEFYVID